jgi:general secretion pathway protein D/MSHA biogenesis protein MshL
MLIKKILPLGACVLSMLFLLPACAPEVQPPQVAAVTESPAVEGAPREPVITLKKPATSTHEYSEVEQLPVRFQRPSYLVSSSGVDDMLEDENGDVVIQVGADISSTTGPIALRDILKRLAALKNMNVSWASDVDQNVLVDVDISAEDDFFKAISNLLRQVDYYHEVHDNTLVIKYKETRKFHIAMPFMKTTYDSGVGGNVMGSSGSNVEGTVRVSSTQNIFDVWENIKFNLDQVLETWTVEPPKVEKAAQDNKDGKKKDEAPKVVRSRGLGKGYYTIDKPIGLITVTAPRPLLEKVASYLGNLKAELYRQVSIEAKVLEVELSEESRTGIDWTKLFSNSVFSATVDFGNAGQIYPVSTAEGGGPVISKISFASKGFDLFLNAIEQQGKTRVLANPKISVMNGQPAMISVGENVTYISDVSSEVDTATDAVTYTATTSRIMSGLGIGVVATIIGNDEIILNLTPVTSQLKDNTVQYEDIGGGNRIGLPIIQIRELNTIVRVRNGEMLVVGGLIDTVDSDSGSEVSFLGDVPLLKHLFKNDVKTKTSRELVILLKPTIL